MACRLALVLGIMACIIVLPAANGIDVNPKTLKTLDAELTISGNVTFTGSISRATLRVYIPQENVANIQVAPSTWRLVQDGVGNDMVEITWNDPAGLKEYEIKVLVNNKAKFFDSLDTERWHLENATMVTESTRTNEEMRRVAAGDETDLEKALRIFGYIDRNFQYDYSALESDNHEPRSAMEVWNIKRAISGEFSNLIVAMLRSQYVPGRVIYSYTFSELDDTFSQKIAHGWAEAYINGKWVPLDMTFFEAGWLDASHIKFANLYENEFSESLQTEGFVGSGANWKRGALGVHVLGYSTFSGQVTVSTNDEITGGSYSLVQAGFGGSCSLKKVSLHSCLGPGNNPFFDVYDSERTFWSCGQENMYWVIKAPDVESGTSYTCQITVFDGIDSKKTPIRITSGSGDNTIELSGPSVVSVGETFSIESGMNGLFFSPNISKTNNGNSWTLSLPTTGKYKIYFYSAGTFGQKDVEVVDEKKLSITRVEAPLSIDQGGSFTTRVHVKNLSPSSISSVLTITFGNQTVQRPFIISGNEELSREANLTAYEHGRQRILYRLDDGYTQHESFVDVAEKRSLSNYAGSFIDAIISAIDRIISLFRNLLN